MELWDSYRFCPRCGAAAEATTTPPFKCRRCGYVRFFNPACAVAAFVVDPRERTLFIRRAHEPSIGRLGLPGGFVDAGESAEAAIRREVFEEVGISLNGIEYFGSWPNRYPTPHGTVPVCDLFFIARVESNRTKPAVAEVADVIWVPPDRIPLDEIAFDSMRRAVEAFVRRAGVGSDATA
jgi:NADH pyrophosphatase NudC (nudix superfamily)